MNIILIENSDLIESHKAQLEGRRASHIIKVIKAEIGDKLRVGIVDGQLGEALVTDISRCRVELELNLTHAAPAALPVILIMALPRPKVLKRVLGSAITMGVKKIFLFNSWRVEKSYWQTPLLTPDKLNEISLTALEQAIDTILPEIILKPRFRPFAEDEVPILARDRNALILHPYTEKPATTLTKAATAQRPESALIAIGPEGGFIPFEVEMLMAAGLKPLTLGPRILRVEQAVPSALAHFLKTSTNYFKDK
jgi:RsmE family RNA methyltransferase